MLKGTVSNRALPSLHEGSLETTLTVISYFFHILFNYKARDNTNKKITMYYVVWTRLTRVGCFNWLAHYKRMRIADKNNVHCTF